ncbi:paralemmin 1a isoform X1 [Megalops cyprinoides]|uniref:paralemmin 1a isoform X1 n=1 Tax=Megalops cyprinoides TaxID=118141 RepID=UPI001865594D|nr:paralemmin 1a isoform X1 [Megalops cyprinoides]
MEMSEALSQQERLQAIAEKRKRQMEIENKRRQLEDDRRQLQHLKSKALRERWLLDGAPSAGPEEDEATKQLQEDEAKTKGLEESILRLEQELEELETGVSATSTKENLSDAAKEEDAKTGDNKNPAGSVKVAKVHNSPRLDKSGGASDMMKAVVHEVRGADGAIENGVHLLSSSEVEELIHKADEASMGEGGGTPKVVGNAVEAAQTPKKEITGIEAKGDGSPQTAVSEASAEHPVTMVFMGYQSVEDEAETKKVLGLEGTVKAELVVIEDGESKGTEGAKEDQAPPNGSAADPVKAQEGAGEKGEPEGGTGELNTKEKQPCKCCSVM